MDRFSNIYKKFFESSSVPHESKTEWNNDTLELLKDFSIEEIPEQNVTDIINESKKFPIPFPTESNRCEYLSGTKKIPDNILNRNINSVYPIVHEQVLKMCCYFILFKRIHGNSKEKRFYNKIGLKDLINRLIIKRAVCFVGSLDHYMLLDKTTGCNQWDSIGTDLEKPPLNIEQYLTYDELKLSALLSISSYTFFVNEGGRINQAKYQENRDQIETEGIIIGLIGPRLHRSNAVESEEIIITEAQNTKENGFGLTVRNSIPKLFAEFYDEPCLEYHEMLKIAEKDKSGRYINILGRYTFDNIMYYKRLIISIDTLLGEANSRAKNTSQLAFVHVVGLGLGAWKVSAHQDQKFVDTFADRIRLLGEKISHIGDLYFAYIDATKCGEFGDGDLFPIQNHPNGGIRIHFGKKDPHTKLDGEDQGKLLVVSYAWDGNALPGNEYWFGNLHTSGDPAAACSTQVTEIHNPHINPLVSADTLRIVTEGNVMTFREYRINLFSTHSFK